MNLETSRKALRIARYVWHRRQAWSVGYAEYKEYQLRRDFSNPRVLDAFRDNGPLPAGYGARLDDRLVEYPWLCTLLSNRPGSLFDDRSTLYHRFVLSLRRLAVRSVVCMTLARESNLGFANVAYTHADLRRPPVVP